ncbi:hypothetical protein GIB67_035206 [Kingdonia uniflora]|uniref:Uncharacterized protein n=1 Tax=Kingdonia uniflora TaxID=39325 RepID=A0A7J7KXM1_9MAGN|nr:hypothetical protein GIB67_035206 [Kingdonia uniflora]
MLCQLILAKYGKCATTARLLLPSGGTLVLQSMRLVSKLGRNLISVSKLADDGKYSDIKELIYEEKDLTKVVENFKKLSKSKFIHFRHGGRNNTYELTIRRLASAKQFSAIEEILEEQKKYNNILKEGFAIRIISLYGKAGMVDHAFKTLEQIPELKCDRTIKYVNALLSAYVDSKKYDGSRASIS